MQWTRFSPGILFHGLRSTPDVGPTESAVGPEGSSASTACVLEEVRHLLLGVGQNPHEVGRDGGVEIGSTKIVSSQVEILD